MPTFDWKAYFGGIGAPELRELSVTSKAFFAGLDRQLRKQPLRVWSNYLQWQLVHGLAPMLPRAFSDEDFAFVSQLTGQPEQPERWKRCIAATDNALPHYLGRAYVAAMFGAEQKAAVEMMVGGISNAFAANVAGYDWMDDATKARAVEKREMMAYLIGYPATWDDYDLELVRDDFAANTLATAAWKERKQLGKIGKPVDRNEWMMSPATVNAYYHPLKNHMVFPAAILQPPFYSPDASLAVNLGGLGMIVGHELTHGFDDSGAKFAGNGALENWWTPSVGQQFEAKTECVAQQYASYEVLPGASINGKLTLGENIADLGGVKLAFQAYRALRSGEGPAAGGFTEDQQFFLAVGQAWCSKFREPAMRMRLQTDTHSPPRFRVNGSLANIPAFAEAFRCEQGTTMNRANTCSVW
jgi:putative endopeptidase